MATMKAIQNKSKRKKQNTLTLIKSLLTNEPQHAQVFIEATKNKFSKGSKIELTEGAARTACFAALKELVTNGEAVRPDKGYYIKGELAQPIFGGKPVVIRSNAPLPTPKKEGVYKEIEEVELGFQNLREKTDETLKSIDIELKTLTRIKERRLKEHAQEIDNIVSAGKHLEATKETLIEKLKNLDGRKPSTDSVPADSQLNTHQPNSELKLPGADVDLTPPKPSTIN